MNRQPMDEWFYTGAGATYGVFNNAAAADYDSVNPPFQTDLSDTAHGLLGGSLFYAQGSVNYNGLRKLVSVPDANSMYIYAKYVAETLAGTETWKTMYSDNHPFEFLGFEVTLSAAGAATENLTIIVDANAGSAYDNELYERNFNRPVNFMDFIIYDYQPIAALLNQPQALSFGQNTFDVQKIAGNDRSLSQP